MLQSSVFCSTSGVIKNGSKSSGDWDDNSLCEREMAKQKVVHRWQPTGYTPCGRKVDSVFTNIGRYLSEGVTCRVCKGAASFCSILNDEWNGQSDGFPRAEGATHLYKGNPVRLLELTYCRAGQQYCTVLMENVLGRQQRQTVRLRHLILLEDSVIRGKDEE